MRVKFELVKPSHLLVLMRFTAIH